LLEELSAEAVREALVEGEFFYQHVVEGDPPVVEAIRHDPDRAELRVEARDDDAIQWASAGSVVGRGPRFRYRDADVDGYVRARLVTDGGSEIGTQPFLLE
jgi:hypothetical protein